MTSTEIRRSNVTRAVAEAGRIGQGTAIEQSRAIAEVQAAVVMAKEFPRDIAFVEAELARACADKGLAEKAFYSKPRGERAVTGPSVHLARELMRIWGNVDFGVRELRRDDEAGQSEIQAIAWDLQTNNRSSSIYIVPHARIVSSQVKKIIDLDQIYENNANNGARRLREAIYAVLPGWYVSKAEDLCHETLRKGDGEPLEDRAAKAVASFTARKVSVERLEAKVGRKVADWTEDDVVQLGIDFQSILRGEAKASEMFPVPAQGEATKDGIKAQAQRQAAGEQPAEPPDGSQSEPAPEPPADEPQPPAETEEATEPITRAQLTKLHTLLTKCAVPADQKHRDVSTLAGRVIESTKDLTKDEAATVIDKLEDCARGEEPALELEQVLDELRRADAEQGGVS